MIHILLNYDKYKDLIINNYWYAVKILIMMRILKRYVIKFMLT